MTRAHLLDKTTKRTDRQTHTCRRATIRELWSKSDLVELCRGPLASVFLYTMMMMILCAVAALAFFPAGSDAVATINLAPFNTSAVVGGNATIACIVTNQGQDKVKWYKPGDNSALNVDATIVSSDSRYAIQGQYNLTVAGVLLTDEGEYRCEVGSNSYTASLTVVVLPTNVSVYWGTSPVAGGTANLTCYASRAHPPATAFSWFKNDMALDTSSAFYTENTDNSGYGEAYSTLPVALTSNDEGAVFRCEADYPDYNDAVHANLTTTFSGSVGLLESSLGCDSLCEGSNSQRAWTQKLTPSIAFWYLSTCGIQSCPDFNAFAADVAALMRQQLCPAN